MQIVLPFTTGQWHMSGHETVWLYIIVCHVVTYHDTVLNCTIWHNKKCHDIMRGDQQSSENSKILLSIVCDVWADVCSCVTHSVQCRLLHCEWCVGALLTVSGWTDERGSSTERALWPVACSLYNSLHFQGQMTAKYLCLPLSVTHHCEIKRKRQLQKQSDTIT